MKRLVSHNLRIEVRNHKLDIPLTDVIGWGAVVVMVVILFIPLWHGFSWQ